jgi:hypothetical protein
MDKRKSLTTSDNIFSGLSKFEADSSLLTWKYVDIFKFLSMFLRNALFFPTLDQFEDPFEGAIGSTLLKKKWESEANEFANKAVMESLNKDPEARARITNLSKYIKDATAKLKKGERQKIKGTYINCWHENPIESALFWKIYDNDKFQTIAIKSSVDRIRRALGLNHRFMILNVEYLDYRKKLPHTAARTFTKRNFYTYENEIRIIIDDISNTKYEDGKNGKYFSCDIDTLIDKIVLPPFTPEWKYEVFTDLLQKYNWRRGIEKSELDDIPI